MVLLNKKQDDSSVLFTARSALTFVPFSAKSFMLALQPSSSSLSARFSCSAFSYFSFKSDSSALVSSFCTEWKQTLKYCYEAHYKFDVSFLGKLSQQLSLPCIKTKSQKSALVTLEQIHPNWTFIQYLLRNLLVHQVSRLQI